MSEQSHKVLFVDDEVNVLESFQRQLRKVYTIETAESGAAALALMSENGPYTVIVSDMRMPAMDGAELLEKVSKIAPHTVRIMLTGNADQKTAMDAVNRGSIFRFLTKPCAIEQLVQAIEGGIAHYELARSEIEILDKTLLGIVGVLTEILAGVQPRAFSRAAKIRSYVKECSVALDLKDRWQLELAALLGPIGHLTLSPELAAKLNSGGSLSAKEQGTIVRLPEITNNLLKKIPRLDEIARIIYHSARQYNGNGYSGDKIAGESLPYGSRLLKILSDFVDLENARRSRSVALRLLHNRTGWYDPALLAAVSAHFQPERVLKLASSPVRTDKELTVAPSAGLMQDEEEFWDVAFEELVEGDVLFEDVCSSAGKCLLGAGTTITGPLHERLRNLVALRGVQEPVRVLPTAA